MSEITRAEIEAEALAWWGDPEVEAAAIARPIERIKP